MISGCVTKLPYNMVASYKTRGKEKGDRREEKGRRMMTTTTRSTPTPYRHHIATVCMVLVALCDLSLCHLISRL